MFLLYAHDTVQCHPNISVGMFLLICLMLMTLLTYLVGCYDTESANRRWEDFHFFLGIEITNYRVLHFFKPNRIEPLQCIILSVLHFFKPNTIEPLQCIICLGVQTLFY